METKNKVSPTHVKFGHYTRQSLPEHNLFSVHYAPTCFNFDWCIAKRKCLFKRCESPVPIYFLYIKLKISMEGWDKFSKMGE